MIKGIDGKPYIDLDPYLDIEGFKKLHPENCAGLALAKDYVKEGTWMAPGFDMRDSSYIMNWKPIYVAMQEYLALPNTHPIRVAGDPLYYNNLNNYENRNVFTRYLKNVLGANDPYTYYFLWNEGDWNNRDAERYKAPEAKFFPGLVNWVENLVTTNIISQIGRVMFFVCDHNGRAFEHRDIGAESFKDKHEYTPHRNEFIHIRPRTKRGFYIWDPDTQNKVYINSHAAWWHDQDWHGGEESKEVEYSVRIDCVFTEDFRKKLGINHLDLY